MARVSKIVEASLASNPPYAPLPAGLVFADEADELVSEAIN